MILVNIHNNCHIARSICQFLDFMFPELWAPFEIIGLFLGFPDSSVGKESAWKAGDPCSILESGRFPGERIGDPLQCSWASLVAQLVKNPPAMREIWVRPLGWEDPLEKGKATHSSILAWRIPWTVHGLAESDTTERLSPSLSTLTVLNPWASHSPGLTQPHWSLISRLLCRTLCFTLTSQYCSALRDFLWSSFPPRLIHLAILSRYMSFQSSVYWRLQIFTFISDLSLKLQTPMPDFLLYIHPRCWKHLKLCVSKVLCTGPALLSIPTPCHHKTLPIPLDDNHILPFT